MRRSFVVVAVLAVTGCGPSYAPVEGKVVWEDDTPATELAGGVVQLEPPENGIGGRGTIGPDGSFKLGTEREGDGVIPGEYRAGVAENRPVLRETDDGAVLAPPKMDPKFGDWQASGLKVVVTRGSNTVTLKVSRAKK
jgi:hypothetical protein